MDDKAQNLFYRLLDLIDDNSTKTDKEKQESHYWLIASQIARGFFPRGLTVSEAIAVGWL